MGHLEGNLVRFALCVLEVTRDCHISLKYSYCSSKQRLLTATKSLPSLCQRPGQLVSGVEKAFEDK